jgi:plasmid stabilization system protein ParE
VKRKVVLRPAAERDVERARDAYREVSAQLSNRFRESVRERIRRIAERPEMYPCITGEIRRAITRDFPYSVFFAIDTPDRVVVLRVIHHAQDPTEWPTTA